MSEVTFHFLNVGKGNCTIVDFPSGNLSVIDIDDSRSLSSEERNRIELSGRASLTNPVSYITKKFGDRAIFRFILTHPDMDHMSGIRELFNTKEVINFWDTDNRKYVDPNNWEDSLFRKEDWDFYQKIRKSKDNPKVLTLYRGAKSNCCWVEDGIKILSPSEELVEKAEKSGDYDHLSYVLMIEFAKRKVLLCGDATKEALRDIINFYGDLYSDILFAPNHGSKHHISREILDVINPRTIIVSVAEGIDYARDLYSEYGIVLSTKYYGNIIVKIKDNGEIIFTTQFQNYSNGWYRLRDRIL